MKPKKWVHRACTADRVVPIKSQSKTWKDRFRSSIFLCVVILAFLSSCSTHLPVQGIRAYHQCDYQAAQKIFANTPYKEKDALLFDLALLSTAIRTDDHALAKTSGKRALGRIWSYEGKGAGQASLISSEALRFYQGEPFEKTMAAIYLGITYFNEKDYENARAAFTKATLAEKMNGDKRTIFVLPYLFLAKTYLQLNDPDNAHAIMNRLSLDGSSISEIDFNELSNAKTLVMIELGSTPHKIRTGPGDSLIGWQRSRYLESYARLYMDSRMLANSKSIDDLTYQASTINRGSKETLQATKGILRDVATVTTVIAAQTASESTNQKTRQIAGWTALGAGLFALANQSQADVRQWEMLPDRLHLILTPEPTFTGPHQYKIEFFDKNQYYLSSMDQRWSDQRSLEDVKIIIKSPNHCNKPGE